MTATSTHEPWRPRGRVLQITRALSSSVGGIEKCVRAVTEELTCRDIETRIVVPGNGEPGERFSRPELSSVIAAPFEDVESLTALAESYEPDAVVLHHLGSAEISDAMRCRFLTMEVVHTMLCSGSKLFRRRDTLCQHPVGPRCLIDWYLGPCGPQRSPLTALRDMDVSAKYVASLKRLETIVVGSRYMRTYLIGEGIDPDRIRTVDLAVGPRYAYQSEIHRDDRPRGESPTVLFVGRVVYGKGLQYLVRAFAELNGSARLEVVGEGWFLPNVKRLVGELGVSHLVHFHGTLTGSDLDDAYERADVVVVPSIVPEPLGLVVGEARRLGLPVVVSEAGGLPEWAEGDSGVIVTRRADVRTLSEAIRAACARPLLPRRKTRLHPLSLGDLVSQAVASKRSES